MAKTLVLITLVAALALPAPPAAALEVDQDLLALVAMPLAVAAVSEITDVPANELIDVVTLLNDADVDPVQFVEVVRYVPVALVVEDDAQPRFVDVIREQEQAGVRGPALVTFIEQRLQTFGMPSTVDFDVVSSPAVELDRNEIVPTVVRTHITEVKAHPHGGPPGQLKKAAGLKTGAEIVHRRDDPAPQPIVRNNDDNDKPRKQKQPKKEKDVTRIARDDDRSNHGHGNGHGNGHGQAKAKGNNGKGKGKG